MEAKARFSRVRLFVGLALIIPMLTACLLVKVFPALLAFALSLTEYDILSPPRFVGLENYGRLLADPLFFPAVRRTVSFVIARLFVVAVLPVVLGFLLSRLGRWGRTIFRVWFTLIVLLFVPMSLFQGWRVLTDPQTGLLGKLLFFSDPARSLLSLLIIDGSAACAIGCTLGTMIYGMVFRGAGRNWRRAHKPLLATWLITNLAVIVPSLLVFDLPFVLTKAGPTNSTMTWMFHGYSNLFQYFRVGYGAAIHVALVLLCSLCVLLVWVVSEWSGLRLVYVPASQPSGNNTASWLIGILMVPVALIVALPILVPHVGNLVAAAKSLDFATEVPSLVNSLIVIVPVLFLAIPGAYLAAVAIALVKPLGRVCSKFLFLAFLLGSVLPVPLLAFPLFRVAYALRWLDTTVGLMMPYLASGIAFYTFKLFFDGRKEPVKKAMLEGASTISAVFQQAILPSLPILFLIAVALTFASVAVGGLYWMLIVINSLEKMPWPLFILFMNTVLGGEAGVTATYALGWTALGFGLYVVPAVLLQIFLVDRLALVGKSEE